LQALIFDTDNAGTLWHTWETKNLPGRMNIVATYFTVYALLLLLYFILRFLFVTYVGCSSYNLKDYLDSIVSFKPRPVVFNGKGIEATQLRARIQHVREDLAQAKVPTQSSNFKRALAVENKRAQIAKLAFFQSPPTPEAEPPDQEHGLHLFLV
jgi:hypothetical protein